MESTAAWRLILMALLVVANTHKVLSDHSGEVENHHVSAGFLFLLRCPNPEDSAGVTWSRGDGGNSSLPPGVEEKDGVLWFLPVQMSHSGAYTCEKRNGTGLRRMNFRVSVSSERCPNPSENRSIPKGVSGLLLCKQEEIFRLSNSRNVRWMKDCPSVQQEQQQKKKKLIPVDEKGSIRLLKATEKDAGIYTCLVDVNLDGKNYTAARSVQMILDNSTDTVEPHVLFPQQDVFFVKVGMRAEVKCYAYIGAREDNEIVPFWTVDEMYSEHYKELNESWGYVHEGGKVFCQSSLSISKVLPQFLDVPITCHIQSPLANKNGSAWLREADHSSFHLSVTLCLVASVALGVAALLYFFFKVDLVLAYRKLLRHFPKQHVSDGKWYDAYVSVLHPDAISSEETERFSHQMLPEELEGQHGYTLYIRGRDDCPGEAIHDAISATVRQCRRLIIILSSQGKSGETQPLCDRQNQLCYDQKVGLYDALTQKEPRVILVEIGGPVDYSLLPESLGFIKRKYGALKWKSVYLRTRKLSKIHAERQFWKNLRYNMPSVPAKHLRPTV